jgi:adenylosuccinate lyase
MEAVKTGAGRETAHEAIKEHALAAAKALRSGGNADLLNRLAADKRVGLGKKKLQEILAQNERFVGAAPHQVDAFVEAVQPLGKKQKGVAEYRPGKIL